MTSTAWPLVCSLLAAGVPFVFGLAALWVSPSSPFRSAARAASSALGLASLVALGLVARPLSAPVVSGLRLDLVTGVMLLLICTLAFCIVRYSRHLLQGDPAQVRFVRALFAALAAVTTVVVSNNLAVISLAWAATSIALHALLTFYPERPQALIAAHKKFVLSRCADLCLVAALGLLASVVPSLDLDAIEASVRTHDPLPPALTAAALLLVLTVCLKSAQLPFHGWLMQVMEAPTPVSALLHAGVVNLGGFLLLRLAPLIDRAPLAQALLVAVGLSTTVLASLIMTTRVSVKVGLAWSTCAQMGFMLVECGLGLWPVALLHLVAHSLYKAHAFLSAGSTVEKWRTLALAPRPTLPSLRLTLSTTALLLALSAGTTALFPVASPRPLAVLTMMLVSLSWAMPLARSLREGRVATLFTVLRSQAVLAAALFWHASFEPLVSKHFTAVLDVASRRALITHSPRSGRGRTPPPPGRAAHLTTTQPASPHAVRLCHQAVLGSASDEAGAAHHKRPDALAPKSFTAVLDVATRRALITHSPRSGRGRTTPPPGRAAHLTTTQPVYAPTWPRVTTAIEVRT